MGVLNEKRCKKTSPETSFLILEKYNKKWVGGRTSNDFFYGTEIVTGAGIGRKKKDKLLLKLLDELDLKTKDFTVNTHYSNMFEPIDVKKVMGYLRSEYKTYKGPPIIFKRFAKKYYSFFKIQNKMQKNTLGNSRF